MGKASAGEGGASYRREGDVPGILDKLDRPIRVLGLIVLVVEAIIGILAFQADGTERLVLIVLMVAILALVIGAIVYLEARKTQEAEASAAAPAGPTIVRDIFISAPMAAYGDDGEVKRHREAILKIKDALRQCCAMDDAFYAGLDISASGQFESEDIAFRKNWKALRESARFVMIWPERLPSSSLVEAGMAIALGKDCVFFVRDRKHLPFLLRGAPGASRQDGLPSVKIYEYDDFDDIVTRMKNDGKAIFS